MKYRQIVVYGIALLILLSYAAGVAAGAPGLTSVTPAAGQAGYVVTLNGSGFDSNGQNNVVQFGGNQASVISATTAQLIVAVPNGQPPGPTTITVAVAGQTSGVLRFLTIATQKIASVPTNPSAGCVLGTSAKGAEGCVSNPDPQTSPCVPNPMLTNSELAPRDGNVYGERGESLQFVTDLFIPGRPGAVDGLQFSVERQYRAASTSDGPMGSKWGHKFFEALTIQPNGSVVHSNGLDRNDVYTVNNLGTLVAPPDVFARLIKNANGTYDLRYKDGAVKHFNSAGKILVITDRNNNTLTFSYNAQNQLAAVTDALGRSFAHTYNSNGQLTGITDFGGRRVSYAYDAVGNLASVTSPAVTGTPNGNDFPIGKTTKYTYDANHMLLTVTRPNESASGGPPVLQFTYDSQGRVSTLTYGGTNASGIAAGGTYTFTYTPLNSGTTSDDPNLAVMRTQQTDPNGNVLQHDYNRLGYPVVIREFTRGLRPGDPPSYITTLTYNADGRLTQKTLPAGNIMRYQYDEGNPDRLQQGNMLSQTFLPDARGGDQTFVKTSYTYEPVFNHIATSTESRGNDPTYIPQNGGAQSAARYTTTFTYDAPGNLIKLLEPAVTLPNGNTQTIQTDYTYNTFGQMTSMTDPEGNVTQYQYCSAATPVCSSPDPAGGGYLQRKILDAANSPRRTEPTPPAQITTQLLYDAWGNVIQSIDGRGNTTSFTVNQLNQVVATRSAAPYNYMTLTYYDANDNVVRRDVQNQVATTADNKPIFTGGNFASAVGSPASFIHRYTYDILDKLVTNDEDAAGSTPARLITQYRYDGNRNRVQIMEPAGNVTLFQYDERNLRLKMTQGAGTPEAATSTFNYDSNRNVTSLISPRNLTTTLQYDGLDRNVRTTDAVGGQTVTHYDPAGNAVSVSALGQPGGPSPADNSGAGNVLLRLETYAYDELNRRFQADQQPVNGASFVASGVSTGRPPSVVPGGLNPPAISRRTIYDRNSRVVTSIDDDSSTYSTQWDGMNRVVQETDALGNAIQYTYDASNNVIQTVETDVSQIGAIANETFTTQFIYDNLNRLTQETDNCSNTRRWAYDSRDDLTNDTDARGDNASGCAGTVNAHGNSTLYTYDGQSRWLTVSEDLRNGGIGPGAVASQIALSHTYDGNGRLASLTDSNGNTYRYQYDSLNRVVIETFPDNTTKTYTYDPNSNTKAVTDNNGTTWMNTYDNLDRLTATNVARGAGVIGTTSNTFQYDGLHRKTLLADNNDPLDPASASTLGLAYDSLGRIVEETQNGLAVDSGWTAHARRTSLTYPNGRRVDFAFDLLERIQGIQDHGAATGLAGYSYMGPGRVIQRSYQNGTRLTYLNAAGTADTGYDALRRTVGRQDLRSNNSLIGGFNYVHDREYNKNSETKLHLPGTSETYAYDSAYRLTQVQRGSAGGPPAKTEQWNLDPAGNWLTDTINGIPGSRTVNNLNQYTTVNSAPLAYDKNGNLTSAALGYQWDYRNRLRQVCSLPAGGGTCASPGAQLLATYSYDALDRRTRKVVVNSGTLNGTTNFLYDGWTVIEERDGANAVTQQYVHGADLDEPVVLDSAAGSRYFYHQNDLGSVYALTDTAGNVVEGYDYEAYGQHTVLASDFTPVLGTASMVGNPFLFTGQRYDAESGLLYFRNRYYLPQLGRFLSRDPVQFMDTDSLYAYVDDRPTAWLDPLGLCRIAPWAGKVPGLPLDGACATVWYRNPENVDKIPEKDLAFPRLAACREVFNCRIGNCAQGNPCEMRLGNAKPPEGGNLVLAGATRSNPGGGGWGSANCCCGCGEAPAAANPQNGAPNPQAGRAGGGNQGGGGRGGQQGGGNGQGGGRGANNGGGNPAGGGRGGANGPGGGLAGRGGNGNPGGAGAGRGGGRAGGGGAAAGGAGGRGNGNPNGGGAAAGRASVVNITINIGAPAAPGNGNVPGAAQANRNPNTVVVINDAGNAPGLPGNGRGSRAGRGGRGQ